MSHCPRSDDLARLMRIAHYCEKKGLSTAEGLEQALTGEAEARKRLVGRRQFMTDIGKCVAAGALIPTSRVGGIFRSVSPSIGIVGAGLAGLSCADALRSKGITSTLYDANSRTGGRCWSLRNFFPGQVAERGGEFIDTTHTTLRGYANALGLTLEDVNKEPGSIAYYFDGRHYDEAQVVEEFRAFVPAMREDLRVLAHPTADKFSQADRRLDLTPLSDYLASRGAGPLIRQVVDVAYVGEYGLDISQQSCLSFLLFIHADRRSKFHPF